jgi:hydroxymethylglutaryl-CoA lyase
MGESVRVREVGLRDGLQLVRTVVPTERKLEWCRRAVGVGIAEMEITSFVPAKIIPQFGDAAEVALGAHSIQSLDASVLVPNLKGAERAFEVGVPKINYVLSASEHHNLANVRRNTAESLADFARIVAARDARRDPDRIAIAGGLATAFGCAIAGEVCQNRVLEIADTLLATGADELIIADTVGYANPAQVRSLVGAVVRRAGDVPVVAHFHDTRGLGLANVVAALDIGVRAFDASLGGLGGCPFAPGATGNINTEDCVYLLQSMGYETGIDIDGLIGLRALVGPWIPEETLTGAVARAGLPNTYRQPADEQRRAR